VTIGTPEHVVKVKRSDTATFLKPVLARCDNTRNTGVRAAG
jgi:hypothetical protein